MNYSLDRHASHGYRSSFATAETGRRQPLTAHYDSSDIAYAHSRRLHQPLPEGHLSQRAGVNNVSYGDSAIDQSAFHGRQFQNYVQSLSAPLLGTEAPTVCGNGWQPRNESPATLRKPHGSQSPHSDTSAMSYGRSDPHHGQHHPQLAYGGYAATAYQSSSLHAVQQGSSYTAAMAPSFSGVPSNLSAPLGCQVDSVESTGPRAPSAPRCEWESCRAFLEDTTPAGIARHLKQYHKVQVNDNRNRNQCLWGAQPCRKDMYPSSYGKHIAECHLRNMVKQCPYCGADFARADTLTRHIKAFCPHSSG